MDLHISSEETSTGRTKGVEKVISVSVTDARLLSSCKELLKLPEQIRKLIRRAQFTHVTAREVEIVSQLFVPDWRSERHDAAITE